MPSERTGPVSGVVLAAGDSTRMGRNKLLLDVEGEPVLRRAVRRSLDAGLFPVVVVVGFQADQARALLTGLPCQTVTNHQYERGINGSVRLGMAAVPADAIAAVVILPDMPFVTAQMIRALTDRYRSTDAPLVISRYEDVNAPPTLYDRALFGEFDGPDGEGCGKRVVERYRREAMVVEWPVEALADLDVPEDYARITERVTSR